ncbi:MAG: hypothetical protein KIT22_03045 [Verrucomicrobiae bacterium]|nr:hypothetical protein [Verrucomicrobiae bacterium]
MHAYLFDSKVNLPLNLPQGATPGFLIAFWISFNDTELADGIVGFNCCGAHPIVTDEDLVISPTDDLYHGSSQCDGVVNCDAAGNAAAGQSSSLEGRNPPSSFAAMDPNRAAAGLLFHGRGPFYNFFGLRQIVLVDELPPP